MAETKPEKIAADFFAAGARNMQRPEQIRKPIQPSHSHENPFPSRLEFDGRREADTPEGPRHEVNNPALPHEDFAEAVRIAQAEFKKHRPQVVGSSCGGAVAINMDSGEARLVLLCPAWQKYGTAKAVKAGTIVLDSRADDVVPFSGSEKLPRSSKAQLIEVGTVHRLAAPNS